MIDSILKTLAHFIREFDHEDALNAFEVAQAIAHVVEHVLHFAH